jgi:protein phosphatase
VSEELLPASPDLALRWLGHSEIGLVRKNNQDSAYASPNLLIVADGMGGAAAGDLASAVVIREMARVDGRYCGDEMLQALSNAVDRASDAIAELVESDPELDGMGSTATGIMFDQQHYGIVNIGDSRTYLYREGKLSRLTHDHSFVQTLVDDGRITEEESLTHPHRSLILRVISGLPQHMPDLEIIPAAEGDRILVCSDGLCGMITDAEIEASIAGERADVVEHLLNKVYAEGAQDNISILLADVVAGAADGAAEVFGAAAKINVEESVETTGELALTELAEPRPDPTAAERMRYAPTARHRRITWVRLLVAIAVPLILLAGGFGLWYGYTQQQYYIGPDQQVVALYRGVPEPVFNLPLSTVVDQTEVKLEDLPRFYREQVNNWEYRGSLESVQATLADLRRRAALCAVSFSPPSDPAEPDYDECD